MMKTFSQINVFVFFVLSRFGFFFFFFSEIVMVMINW